MWLLRRGGSPPNFQMMGGSSGRRNRTGAVSNDYQCVPPRPFSWTFDSPQADLQSDFFASSGGRYYVCEPFAGGDAVASWIFPDIGTPFASHEAQAHALIRHSIAPFRSLDCRKITTVVNYPWCWNGKELSTGQPSTHVRYPNGTDWVDCPDSEYVHPDPFYCRSHQNLAYWEATSQQLPRSTASHFVQSDVRHDALPLPIEQPHQLAGRQVGLFASWRVRQRSVSSLCALLLNQASVLTIWIWSSSGWQEGYLVQVFDTRANCRASLAGGASSNSSACSAGLRDFEPSVGQACKQELASSVVLDESVGLREPIEKLNGCNPYSGASEDGILLPPCGEDGPQGTFVNPASWVRPLPLPLSAPLVLRPLLTCLPSFLVKWGDAQVPLSAEELDDSGDDDEGGSNTGAIVGGASNSSHRPSLRSDQSADFFLPSCATQVSSAAL